ncbi:MAG: pantoate--beta-alanine ligase [Kiritimatiellia bacterium]
MRVLRSTPDMIAARSVMYAGTGRVGFVPTMGYLHAGHLSLIELAREHAAFTVVSLFVNPTQFGPHEDFEKYPRDEARDLALCEQAGVDVVFVPQPADMYAEDASVSIVEKTLSMRLCGAHRPGHFDGVCTVVAKLFQIVQPDIAVFGQKDAQQVAVIRRMVRDLFFPVQIVVGPIVREPDGLAMSSRNVYLTAEERREALGLSCTLQGIRAQWVAGTRSATVLEQWGRSFLVETYSGVMLDYLVFCDPETLIPCVEVGPGCLVAIAAGVGTTRLIDNMVI